MFSKKTIRYYYWLTQAFIQKHLKYILLSFLLSIVFIFILLSLSPIIQQSLLTEKQIKGVVGKYTLNEIPEEITSKISSGLIFVNEKGELRPGLASSWKFNKNGKEYEFTLRDNLYWNDGKEFTAADVNYSFKDVEKKVINNKTVIFQLKQSLPIFATYLKRPIIKYPSNISKSKASGSLLMGVAGLYSVQDVRIEYGYVKEMTLIPNKTGLPLLVYKFYDEEGDLAVAYKKGEIREMQLTRYSLAKDFETWKNSTVQQSVDYTRLMTLFFNMNNPLWKNAQDKEVRQALRESIDISKFNQTGVEAIGSISPLSWAYNPDLKRNTYNPESAMAVLKKLKDASTSAELNFRTAYENFGVADEIVNEFKNVGLKVNLSFISGGGPGNFDFFLVYWKLPTDPDQYFFWHQKQKNRGNVSGYDRPKIDKLLEDGRNTTSIEERKKIYYEFQRTLLDDPPAVFLFYPYVYTIKRK